MKKCSVHNCERQLSCKGYCSMHYQRFMRHGDAGNAAALKADRYEQPCSVSGCDRLAAARGWCKMHHQRWRKHGTTEMAARKPPTFCAECGDRFNTTKDFTTCFKCRVQARQARAASRPTKEQRLADRTEAFIAGKVTRAPHGISLTDYMRAKTVVGDGCWLWAGNKSQGYGKFRLNHKDFYAHRVAYALVNGEIPVGLVIDHICRNRACVNPDHLQAVTQKENNENHSNASYGATGIRGVSFDKRAGKYEAYATHFDRKYSAGKYESIAEAEEAAKELRMRLHTNNLADFEEVRDVA